MSLTQNQIDLIKSNNWKIISLEPLKIQRGDSFATEDAVKLIARMYEAEIMSSEFVLSHHYVGKDVSNVLNLYTETGKQKFLMSWKLAIAQAEDWRRRDEEYHETTLDGTTN